jgi:uncharacterized protein (TIGR02145 family)
MKAIFLTIILLFTTFGMFGQSPNGVKLRNLVINRDNKLTFDISWNVNELPALWSDSVWVFVDYRNDANRMTRLILNTSSATFISTSAPGESRVEADFKNPLNNKGVFIVGNARKAGQFSATVVLQAQNTTQPLGGVCAYATNYPPLGEFVENGTEIIFTGTKNFKATISKNGIDRVIETSNSFIIPTGYELKSFTDATAASGLFKYLSMSGNIDFLTNGRIVKSQPATFVKTSSPTVPTELIYEWSAGDFSPVSSNNASTYVSMAPSVAGTYSVTLTAKKNGYTPLSVTKNVVVYDCHEAGSTATFSNFVPCAAAGAGSTWTLIDERDNKSYKIKRLNDSQYWMVQDLAYGGPGTMNACEKTTFLGATAPVVTDRFGKGTYGDCRTSNGRGYIYDWAAVMQHPNAFQLSNDQSFSVNGAVAGTAWRQGLCPTGWHVPTYDELQKYSNAVGGNFANQWGASSPWEGKNDGAVCENYIYNSTRKTWWSSTFLTSALTRDVEVLSSWGAGDYHAYKNEAGSLRCVRNY